MRVKPELLTGSSGRTPSNLQRATCFSCLFRFQFQSQSFNANDLRRRESHMKVFAVHDLYTKNPNVALESRLPEYEALIKRCFPDPIEW